MEVVFRKKLPLLEVEENIIYERKINTEKFLKIILGNKKIIQLAMELCKLYTIVEGRAVTDNREECIKIENQLDEALHCDNHNGLKLLIARRVHIKNIDDIDVGVPWDVEEISNAILFVRNEKIVSYVRPIKSCFGKGRLDKKIYMEKPKNKKIIASEASEVMKYLIKNI